MKILTAGKMLFMYILSYSDWYGEYLYVTNTEVMCQNFNKKGLRESKAYDWIISYRLPKALSSTSLQNGLFCA